MEDLGAYLPQDRHHALMHGTQIPDQAWGTVLFADISGFTKLTDVLAHVLGPRRGAEELTVQLNRVYEVLIATVQRFAGSVVYFAGDAIICWFDNTACTAACALTLQQAMQPFAVLPLPNGETTTLALKIALASGAVRRWVIGDPAIQLLDVLTGAPLTRMAAGEHLTQPGEVLLNSTTVAVLGDTVRVVAWRTDAATGEHYAVLQKMDEKARRCATDMVAPVRHEHADLPPEQFCPWLLLAVYERYLAGSSMFMIELRPAAALFVRFTGIDYDSDPAAGAQLDTFICRVQAIVARYDGTLLQLTMGDKGSYLYVAFGAPHAHEDDARRAALTALDLHTLPSTLTFLQPLQIGLSSGTMRIGTYGSAHRLTYGVLGDATNVAARLMEYAAPGETLVSASIQQPTAMMFTWVAQPPLYVKGKAAPLAVWALRGPRAERTFRLQEPRYTLPIVGRQNELALAEATMQKVLHGQGHVIGIFAEAGVGKSRLVAEVIRRAQERGFTVYGGECQSYGTNTAYLVWQSIWRALFGLDPTATIERQVQMLHAAVRRLAPDRVEALPLLDLVLHLPLPPNDFTRTLAPQFQKSAREALLLDCMRAAAQEARQSGSALLLVLEDLHWIDALSHDLLEIIARAIVDLPVLIATAYRPPELLRLQAPRVEGLPHFTPLPLGTLTDDEAEQLIMMKVGQPATTVEQARIRDFCSRIVERTQGNPFYIEEIVNYVRNSDIDPADPIAVAALDLPTSLHSLVLSRIDQLRQHEQLTLKVASVIGRTFRVTWLHGYYPDAGTLIQIKTDLEELAQLELMLLETPEPDLAYLFKHVVTQEVAYESLPYAIRAVLHERFARYIAQEAGGEEERFLDLLAYHYDRSGNMAKRREYLRRAGEAAAARYANDAAVDYLSHALALAPEDDLVERYDLLRAREHVYGVRGERAAQRADLDALEAVAAMLNDDERRAEVALRWCVYYYEATNDFAAADAAAQQALAWTRNSALQATIRLHWARVLVWLVDYESVREQLVLVLALFRAHADQQGEAQALNSWGWLAGLQGDHTSARAAYEQALEITRRIGARSTESTVLGNLGWTAGVQGDWSSAQACHTQSLAIARALGDRRGEALAFHMMGSTASMQGDYAAARAAFAQSLTIARAIGNRRTEAYNLDNLGIIACALGDYAAARTYHEQTLALAQSINDHRGEAYGFAGLGYALTGLGQFAEAVEAWQVAIELRSTLGQPHLLTESHAGLARALLEQGDVLEAQAQVEQVLAYLEHSNFNSATAPMRAYFNCIVVLKAAGDARALSLLERAYAELQEKAARMDAEHRRIFLEQVPDNRAIIAAWAARQEPTSSAV